MRSWRELARRLGLPDHLAKIIAEHHTATAGDAGMVRLADMLSLYAQGRVVDLPILVDLSAAVGLGARCWGSSCTSCRRL